MYKAVLFDAYGTVLDVDSAASRLAQSGQFPSLQAKWPELSALWRSKQLSYSWLRSLSQHFVPFWQITCESLDYALEALDLDSPEMREALLDLYRQLDIYPEVDQLLQIIAQAGIPAAILSNGNHQMLQDAFTNAGVIHRFDKLLSVEDLGIFKPAPQVYQFGCDSYNAQPEEILFASSNGWDAAAASAFGYTTFWANRSHMPVEKLPDAPQYIGHDLSELIPLISST